MKYFITDSDIESAIRTQTPGNYPKRSTLHLEHGESLKTIELPSSNERILFFPLGHPVASYVFFLVFLSLLYLLLSFLQ